MEINAVIIDDELNNIENIQSIISKWCTGVNVVGSATSVDTGIEVIRSTKPRLVFLDIQMQDSSGFELLKSFNPVNFEVIFITAYDHYGIQAIKFSALDYLLKPVSISELQQAIAKAKDKLLQKDQNQSIGNLLEYIKKSQKDYPKIALPTLQETHYIKVNEIIRCEASNNYTSFFIRGQDPVLVCKTLKEFEELLKPFDFYRTHQSHLVNFRYVKSLLKEANGTLLMEDQSKIPISRQNIETIKKALNKMS